MSKIQVKYCMFLFKINVQNTSKISYVFYFKINVKIQVKYRMFFLLFQINVKMQVKYRMFFMLKCK